MVSALIFVIMEGEYNFILRSFRECIFMTLVKREVSMPWKFLGTQLCCYRVAAN